MKETGLWSYSVNNDEYFNGDICKSREDAIKMGIKDALDREIVTGTLYVGKTNNFIPIVDASAVLDRLAEDACDECGEFAEDYLRYTKVEHVNELQVLLQKAYDEWESKHQEYKATFYLISETEELDIKELLSKEEIQHELDGKYGANAKRE